MPFLTDLQVKEISDTANEGRGEWQLTSDLVYASANGTVYRVPAGFKTDFASVPRVPIAYLLAGDTASKPACMHDWFYSVPHATTRPQADALFKEAAIGEGVPKWRVWILYLGVRLFGASHWD